MTLSRLASRPLRITALALWVSVALAAGAFAQANPTKSSSATVPSEPGVMAASYGDWVLRCQRLPSEGAPRFCEVSQGVQMQGQTAPIAQLAIGRLPGQEGLRVTVMLPSNLSFPSSVRIGEARADGKDAVQDAKDDNQGAGQVLDLAWRRCVPGGCLADAAVPVAVLKAWRLAEDVGRIGFKDADGREVGVPMSFRGLGPALDALAKENF